MEGKAHRRRDYSPVGRPSRTERDLSSCSAGADSSLDFYTMMTRVIPYGRSGRIRKTPHVCVIGAGVAGLRCAEVLINKGVKVTILEGRDRLGGRVHQTNYLGRHMVDLGPNWIHGTDNNPILDLAHETKTITSSTGEASCTIDEMGTPMDQETANSLSDVVWGIIADAFKYSNHSSSIPPDMSLRDFFVEKLQEKDLPQQDKKTVLQMAQMWGAFIGDPYERQSLKYLWLEECIDGENLFVANTYKAILSRIAECAVSKATIRLSSKVVAVQSGDSTVTETSKVLVSTETEDLEFDEVVVTVPLGCLKRGLPKISPSVPHQISRAITNISYGRLEKIFITFCTAWWDPTYLERLGTTAGPKSARFPFFTHFLHPLYHPANPESWNIELVSLASALPSYLHPTLLFYIHGPCATHVTNLITSLEPGTIAYYNALNEFFHPYYSRLPNYSPSHEKCAPTGILATDWQHDEFAGYGSYTNFQISPALKDGEEEVQLDKDTEALREGMPEQGIWFAGEHTAPFVALGTVTGAWWSGEGVGKRIAGLYGLGDEEAGKEPEDGRSTVQTGKGGETANGVSIAEGARSPSPP